jgi:hypothetical protein
MNKMIKKHFWYYFSFAVIEILGVWWIFVTSFNKPLQYLALGFVVCFYIFWSILHQAIHHTVTKKIVLEYVFIGAMGGIILFFLLP